MRPGSPAAAQRFRSLLGDVHNTMGRAGGAKVDKRGEASAGRQEHRKSFGRAKGVRDGGATGSRGAVGPREDSTVGSVKVEELEITFGIDGMTMPIAGVDGEVSDMSLSYGPQ